MAVEQPCPLCGDECEVNFDCPGWPDHKGRIMVCMNCGNTEVVTCTNDDCQFWYSPEWRRSPYYSDVPMGERPNWFRSFEEMLREEEE